MKTNHIQNILSLFSLLLIVNTAYSQNKIKQEIFKNHKLSKMTELDRNNKIEKISIQVLKENLDIIKNEAYPDDPENLPRIDIEPDSNYLRWENIETQMIKSEELEIYREYYSRFIKDKTLNVGDIVYIANYTTNKYFVWPFVYSIVILDNGKPVEIRFDESRYSKIIYKNDPIKTLQPPLSPLQLPLKTKRDENTKL